MSADRALSLLRTLSPDLDSELSATAALTAAMRIPPAVIPANAGIQRLQSHVAIKPWIPVFAGMTSKRAARAFSLLRMLNPDLDSELSTTAALHLQLRASHLLSSPRTRGSRDFRVMPR